VRHERIADDIYVLTSERYFEVTAGVVVTSEGVVVIDTFPFPEESRALREFALEQNAGPVKMAVLTHSHADHSYGSYVFPDAELIAQSACRKLIQETGQQGLQQAREETPELAEVVLRVPNVTFKKRAGIHLGRRSIDLFHAPGHAPDGLVAYVREDRVLFAGDVLMPIPYIVHGDPNTLIQSLNQLRELSIDHLVQGHGETLLRGEVEEVLDSSIEYLLCIQQRTLEISESGASPEALEEITIEKCGEFRIPPGGLAEQLHRSNLHHLYYRFKAQKSP